MKNRAKWLMMALAMTGIAGAVLGQSSSDSVRADASAGRTGARHWHQHGLGLMLGGGLLHAFHRLHLTAAQQQSVHEILAAAHSQFEAERNAASRPDFAVLSNPGDPNYATALQELQTRLVKRIQQQSQTEQALYQVLTPQQQQQLPQILAAMKAKMAQYGAT
jgi:Spy/CpxP family protein refolding chaperone